MALVKTGQQIVYNDTKANILTYVPDRENTHAYATDTKDIGWWDGSVWHWVGESGGSVTTDYRVAVFNTTDQTLTSGSSNDLTFDSVRYDPSGMRLNISPWNRLVCKSAGMYLILGLVWISSNTTGHRELMIQKNGTNHAAVNTNADQSGYTKLSVSTVLELAVNDELKLVVMHDAGTDLTADAVPPLSPEFIAIKLSSGGDVIGVGGVTSYVHTQMVSSAAWTVTHNLGRHPSVTISDSMDNVVFGDVQYIDNNSLIVSFSATFSGTAYLI